MVIAALGTVLAAGYLLWLLAAHRVRPVQGQPGSWRWPATAVGTVDGHDDGGMPATATRATAPITDDHDDGDHEHIHDMQL